MTMHKGVVVLAAASLLAACATVPPPQEASEKEINAALDPFIACLHINARKLDDHRSDASVIALSLRAACSAEFQRSLEVFMQGHNPAVRRMFMRDSEQLFMRQAVRAVLDQRALSEGRKP